MSKIIEEAEKKTHRQIVLNDSVEIALSKEEVFAYLVDVSRDPEWQEGLVEAGFTSAGPVGVGSTGFHRAKAMGMTIEVGWQLTDFDAPGHIAWKFISGPFTGKESYEMRASERGTVLMHFAELRPNGILRLLRPLIGGSFAKQSEKNMQSLKQILERTSERHPS